MDATRLKVKGQKRGRPVDDSDNAAKPAKVSKVSDSTPDDNQASSGSSTAPSEGEPGTSAVQSDGAPVTEGTEADAESTADNHSDTAPVIHSAPAASGVTVLAKPIHVPGQPAVQAAAVAAPAPPELKFPDFVTAERAAVLGALANDARGGYLLDTIPARAGWGMGKEGDVNLAKYLCLRDEAGTWKRVLVSVTGTVVYTRFYDTGGAAVEQVSIGVSPVREVDLRKGNKFLIESCKPPGQGKAGEALFANRWQSMQVRNRTTPVYTVFKDVFDGRKGISDNMPRLEASAVAKSDVVLLELYMHRYKPRGQTNWTTKFTTKLELNRVILLAEAPTNGEGWTVDGTYIPANHREDEGGDGGSFL